MVSQPPVRLTRLSSSTPLNDSFASQHSQFHPSSSSPSSSSATPTLSRAASPALVQYRSSFEDSNVSTERLEGRSRINGELLANGRVDGEEEMEETAGGEVEGEPTWAGVEGMTPLDETLERIGMGPYQWWLLVLCGFGWLCDNAWLQCVAIILPRVQVHFDVSDRWIGLLSSCTFFGMTFGSTGFGSLSDAYGRRLPFYVTLIWTAVSGFLAALAPTFGSLCLALFCLGIGVGGAMPTDGTLFLENTPRSKHYLLTGLSFFFSLGAVISSVLGLVILPGNSCPHPSEGASATCHPETENQGWRYVLAGLGVITGIFYACRVCLFRLHESAKYLVTSGREADALVVLRNISSFNGRDLPDFTLSDVRDSDFPDPHNTKEHSSPSHGSNGYTSVALDEGEIPERVARRPAMARRRTSQLRLRKASVFGTRLPSSVVRGLDDLVERVEFLFSPEWAKTTILVWSIWLLVAFGYTCFNVFLPKYLEEKLGDDAGGGGGLEETLHDYLLYTISGCPGSLLGAWLIETPLGRRYSMALSTLLTAVGTFVFVLVKSKSGVVLSSMLVSLMSTLMYAVIYGYTPEVFTSKVRGTACGLAAAFSRIAGITAPLLTGALLSVSTALPLYVSAAAFFASCFCMVSLPIETRNAKR